MEVEPKYEYDLDPRDFSGVITGRWRLSNDVGPFSDWFLKRHAANAERSRKIETCHRDFWGLSSWGMETWPTDVKNHSGPNPVWVARMTELLFEQVGLGSLVRRMPGYPVLRWRYLEEGLGKDGGPLAVGGRIVIPVKTCHPIGKENIVAEFMLRVTMLSLVNYEEVSPCEALTMYLEVFNRHASNVYGRATSDDARRVCLEWDVKSQVEAALEAVYYTALYMMD